MAKRKGKKTEAPRRATELVVSRAAAKHDAYTDETISEIRRIWIAGVRNTVVEIGHMLIERYYKNVDAAQSHLRNKDLSLGPLLARVDELPISEHMLKAAVGIAILHDSLPRRVADALSAKHHEILVVLKDPEARLRLGTQAAKEGWTVPQLLQRVREIQPPRRRASRAAHPLDVAVSSVVRAVSSAQVASGLSAGGMRSLSRQQAAELDIKVRRARELLEQIADALARKLRG